MLRMLVLALGLVFTACGDRVIYIECPAGTIAKGSECVPNPGAGGNGGAGETPADTVEPTDGVDEGDEALGGEEVGPGPGTDTEDIADVPPVGKGTGERCLSRQECEGGACLTWPGGACTTLGCTEGSCGEGEYCLNYLNNDICVKECSEDADCGRPDQRCKKISERGAMVQVCMGVEEDAGETGDACVDPTGCQGEMACLSAFPGGYCARLGCDTVACEEGSACVTIDGLPSCLKTCARDDECGGAPGAERRCGTLESGAFSTVDVCISGVEGQALGQPCTSDFECTSGTCQIVGEGYCTQTEWPCMDEADCNGAEFCHVTGTSRKGICSQPCGVFGTPCPGGSFCVSESLDTRLGWCRPGCTGPEDPSCLEETGLRCTWGVPISDGGQPRSACMRATLGHAHKTCQGDAACPDGECLMKGNEGYCSTECGDDSACAFGGSCVHGETSKCYRLCRSEEDCPESYQCSSPPGASRNVCVP